MGTRLMTAVLATSQPGQEFTDTQEGFAGPNFPPAISPPTPKQAAPTGPLLADPVLGLFADVVDDLEAVRIANENRLRSLIDPGEYGHGLSKDLPQVARLVQIVDDLAIAEHQAVLSLQRAMRAHPLGGWVKATNGVGEKQAARLLASIRDPYWNDLHGRPRLVSELWAYCGMHAIDVSGQEVSDTQRTPAAGHPGDHSSPDAHTGSVARVAPARRRGQRSNWNSLARQRVWLIAESCIKCTSSPYRAVYDQARLKYADSTHPVVCARCGPTGKPAAAGTPLSAGHQHARAMRLMCKEILRDLWREAERIHTQPQQTA